jgi:hypothetical protein
MDQIRKLFSYSNAMDSRTLLRPSRARSVAVFVGLRVMVSPNWQA